MYTLVQCNLNGSSVSKSSIKFQGFGEEMILSLPDPRWML